jgi:hypothetical protein
MMQCVYKLLSSSARKKHMLILHFTFCDCIITVHDTIVTHFCVRYEHTLFTMAMFCLIVVVLLALATASEAFVSPSKRRTKLIHLSMIDSISLTNTIDSDHVKVGAELAEVSQNGSSPSGCCNKFTQTWPSQLNTRTFNVDRPMKMI